MATIKTTKTQDNKPALKVKQAYKFKKTYVGDYGFFKAGEVYELTEKEAEVLKDDIEVC